MATDPENGRTTVEPAGTTRRTVKLVLDGMREEIERVEQAIADEKAASELVVERLTSKIATLREQLSKWGDETGD